MSKVDEELSRRFHRAERPVASEDVFESLSRRRARRETLRKAQVVALAVAVLAATAGGFVALRGAFDGSRPNVGEGPVLPANGAIVFSRPGEDGRFHLYAAAPDGSAVRQITDDPTNDTDPAVSPDGRTIAFVHELDRGIQVIATVPIEGGTVTWHTPEELSASDPAWSSDGSRIAFSGWAEQSVPPDVEAPDRYRAVFTVNPTGGTPSRVTDGGISFASDPTWSRDDGSIAFAGGSCDLSCEATDQSDLYVVDVSTTDVRMLTPFSSDIDEEAPAWSPDGSRIAFTRPGEQGDEIWTVAPDGGSETLVATAVDASLEPDLAWAPDGSTLLVSDGDWIYRVDATPEVDPRDNFVQLVEGVSPSWQPVPAGSELTPTVSPEPSPSPSPEPEGRDIGLGFNLCNVERLGGIDFLGDGTNGQAWTGTSAKETGRCPNQDAFLAYLVAADVDGDGAADTFSETVPDCFYCQPFDATDLDADGDEELVVLWSGGSTPSFMIYAIADREIAPVLLAEPGHPEARAEPGQPLTFATGGDEGYSGWVRCESFPAAPVLVVTWRDHPIEGDTMEVHETRFVLQDDGTFHVVGTNDYSAPVGDPVPGVSDEPACGVDFQLFG
jgi:TolB protein